MLKPDLFSFSHTIQAQTIEHASWSVKSENWLSSRAQKPDFGNFSDRLDLTNLR